MLFLIYGRSNPVAVQGDLALGKHREEIRYGEC